MASNPDGGAKFVSVNLNKSYGQVSASSSHGSNGRNRGGGGGSGGSGMVVLSRPRSSQKAGPKVFVPPPLNLPSLRKEHERLDSLGSGGGAGGAGAAGGARPSSGGIGWKTKAGGIALKENNQVGDDLGGDRSGLSSADGLSRTYVPPSVRGGVGGGQDIGALGRGVQAVEKASVLRGEDFPSLQAAIPANQKQKDGLNQKQKLENSEESVIEMRDGAARLGSGVDRTMQKSNQIFEDGLKENGSKNHGFGSSRVSEQAWKQDDILSGQLPLVWLNPRSDWADDERDTGHGLLDRGRNTGMHKNDEYWDGEFDFPRTSVLPRKPTHTFSDRWGQRDNETGRFSSSEVQKHDPYNRVTRTPSREGRDGNWNREMSKDKYIPSPMRDSSMDEYGKRDVGYAPGGRPPWNKIDTYSSRGTEQSARDRFGGEVHNRYAGNSFQNGAASKPSYTSGGKGLSVNDPILSFGRDKRSFSKNDKLYPEDPFMNDFGDPFSVGAVGVVKRKKDTLKQTDFHDPAREIFEAELEMVQKINEQKRQQEIEEQKRASELARKEEEERVRLAREQQERQRRLEEEAREAARRLEQEQLEAIRRAEELRKAREEDRQNYLMEEERRKQAAKQKLLELEERMAKREVDSNKGGNYGAVDEKMPITNKDKDLYRESEMGDWEDGERMVERITTSASSDSSGLYRTFDVGPRPHFTRDGSSSLMDKGKPPSSWRRDPYENGSSTPFLLQDQGNGQQTPRQDALLGSRTYPRKEYYGGPEFMSRTYPKLGFPETHMDDFANFKGQRWNAPGDEYHYGRSSEIESEFHENFPGRYGDIGWRQGRSRGGSYSSYPERFYPSSEADGLYPTGRSRYPTRQPRVLPPPSSSSTHGLPHRIDNDRSGPPNFQSSELQYHHMAGGAPALPTDYGSGHREHHGDHEIINIPRENTGSNQQESNESAAARCDSQSTLSVSSPPSSPTHLSHEDLEEPVNASGVSTAGEGIHLPGGANDLVSTSDTRDVMPASGSISSLDDEEWAVENHEELQEQEEYDEDEEGYQEDDEVHEGDVGNIDLNEDFGCMHLEEKSSPPMMDNMVLGFNEGVEVRMPNDEFERSSRNEDNKFAVPHTPVGIIEDGGAVGGMSTNGQILQDLAVSCSISGDNSSKILQETENAMQNLVIQHGTAPQSSSPSEVLSQVEASSVPNLSAKHPGPSSGNMAAHSSLGQSVTSSIPDIQNQADGPIKLQFGLFSGPTLIPSPVPAIQIGSIQMPLHLHHQVGPSSLAQMHSSQPPLFQFGQLRYTSPSSQGLLPLAPQTMSFVQPKNPANHFSNQKSAGPLPVQHGQDPFGQNRMKQNVFISPVDNQTGLLPSDLKLSQGNMGKEEKPSRESTKKTLMAQQSQVEIPCSGDSSNSELGLRIEGPGRQSPSVRNQKSLTDVGEPARQVQNSASSSQLKENDLSWQKVQRPLSSGRGKRYVYTVKTSGAKASFRASDSSHHDTGGFQRRHRRYVQRTEFRVRENPDRKQSTGMIESNNGGLDDKSNIYGKGPEISTKSGPRKVVSSKLLKQMPESENSSFASRGSSSGGSAEKVGWKAVMRTQQSGEGGLKRNFCPEEDIDAPLQSGVVRVFEQPGIEAPSDEDDFIEVRSKKQMLNDRREQKKKEHKAKCQGSKIPRRSRATSQNNNISTSINKVAATAAEGTKDIRSDNDGHGLANADIPGRCNTSALTQALAPIGTPAGKTDAQSDSRSQTVKTLQTSSLPAVSGQNAHGPGTTFESKDKALDNVQTSLGSWANSPISEQVMTLTQTQLDEAMKPIQFDSHASAVSQTNAVGNSVNPSSSMLVKDISLSSSPSPINSLLTGERIQFGAVTASTVLPSSGHVAGHVTAPTGSSQSDIQNSLDLSASKGVSGIFFDKEKSQSESCTQLEEAEAEAEAEAAASAVAVAAIDSVEIVSNGLRTCPVSVSDTKCFKGADVDETAAGEVAGQQQLGSQSRTEESLTVALPADLSVENPPISWQPLPSPQNSSSPMLTQFPGGAPSHFPFYEMNPMMGGPVYAFGPQDETASSQSQSQKSSVTGSGPLGTWQQCHSNVDSFYGPPAGFTGPFISPPGGIPGVQGPPHMVVYNHFAPLGQFGQVGLSFMGATYIPSGKQPDWKHNPASSAMGVGEGEKINLNMVSAPRNHPNMPAPVQRLAPGSPILPMASPMTVFDVSPFQSSAGQSTQTHWSHVPGSPLQSVPLSMPSHQQQTEGMLFPQFNQGPSIDQSGAGNRFQESQTSASADNRGKFSVSTNPSVTQLSAELGLVDPSNIPGSGASTQSVMKNSVVSTVADASKSNAQNSSGSNSNGPHTSSGFRHQTTQPKSMTAQQYNSSSGYIHHRRGRVSQKNGSGAEWSQRRTVFQGRSQSGMEKNVHPSKMKQIYVAKQTSGTSAGS